MIAVAENVMDDRYEMRIRPKDKAPKGSYLAPPKSQS